MNEGMFIALRSYAEEHSSLLRQILEELKAQRTEPEQTVFHPKLTVQRDMGNIGPIDAATGEPVKPKATTKKGK